MKYLALALLLCTQLHLLHGFCVRMLMDLGATDCEDPVDHTRHPLGSTWTNSACLKCNCGECCATYSRPVSIPEDCTMEFDKKNCEYKVFKKNDPTVPCPTFASVGK